VAGLGTKKVWRGLMRRERKKGCAEKSWTTSSACSMKQEQFKRRKRNCASVRASGPQIRGGPSIYVTKGLG
jgi:hypothetical protein